MEPADFEWKVELLFKGIKIRDPFPVDSIARAGGAGPAGGMFATYRDAFQVNVPMQERMVARSDLVMDPPPPAGPFRVFKEGPGGELGEYRTLHRIPPPSFYDDEYLPKERNDVGTPVP